MCGIFNQYFIVDHNNVICEVWSLDPKDGIELLYHQATPLIGWTTLDHIDLNITHIFKLDDSYLIDKLSKWKNEKFIHKVPLMMYTNYYFYKYEKCELFQKKKNWILLLNNVSMIIPWGKIQTHDL
jgi:hypothetical protein